MQSTLATFLTLDDIAKAKKLSIQKETPILTLIHDAKEKGYDMICLPLTTQKWRTRWEDMCLLPFTNNDEESQEEKKKQRAEAAEKWRQRPGFLIDEVTITRLDEAEGIAVMISDWLQLDAEDIWVSHDAEIALQQELAYASYLNIHTAILPAPKNRTHVTSYARIVNNCLNNTPYMCLSVRLPIYNPTILQSHTQVAPGSPLLLSRNSTGTALDTPPPPTLIISPDLDTTNSNSMNGISSESEMNATWEMWDVIRSMCDYDIRLTLTLDLTPPLPTKLGVLNKWAAESVRYIYLPASTFIANSKGYPVLPKPTQNFIRDNMIHSPTIMLSEVNSKKHSKGGEMTYSQYIKFLEKTSQSVRLASTKGTVENFAQGYQDYLQAPLQPLMDNLQSITYQTFEQDPVKYERYEEAIFRALLDIPKENDRIVCCIAGAGRGPLVSRCLIAVKRSKRNAVVYAVEKNQNAFVTLQQRKVKEWGDKVTLLFGDMRNLDIPEHVDILISELLGSFGDNELSPECLDGAQRFLKETGISIPSSYTAHLAPLSSSKLYNEARSSNNNSKSGGKEKSMETPYVVMFQAVDILSGDREGGLGGSGGGGGSGSGSGSGGGGNGQESCGSKIQECWEFEHPRRDVVLDARGVPLTNSHNVRSATLRFWIPHAGILHGLAGYFEAVLYGNVGLSIHPHRKDSISKDMLSWFPLFFPFKEPLYLPSNCELQVSIWRLTNERQVWYEWHAESFLNVPVIYSKEDSSLSSIPIPIPFTPSSGGIPSPLVDDDSFFASTRTPGWVQQQLHQQQRRGSSGTLGGGGGTGTGTGIGIGGVGAGGMIWELVKIGHTGLHNPGGRSSWIGL